LSSAVGYQTLIIIQRDNLLENVNRMGKYLRESLRQLQLRHPKITDVRGLGLMDAISVDTLKFRDALVDAAFARGLLLAGCGYKSIRFLPPLNVTRREIDIAMNVLEDALRDLA
jgi:4-aminobutyrate aminotransferase